MNFWRKQLTTFPTLARLWKKVTARYESSAQQWGVRSWLNASIQDARFDIDRATRTELLRRSRYWEQNSGIVQRLIDLFEQYTAGPEGLQMVPSSSSDEFNQAAFDWWHNWCQHPDVSSMQSFGVLQGLMARAWFVDGEIFIYKTAVDKKPRIQLIEAHRVGTPQDKAEQEGKTIIDGVKVDPKTSRPVGYYVKTGLTAYGSPVSPSEEEYQLIDAANIVHLFEPCRAGQYRGLPMLYAVMNDLHDLEDLQLFEKKASKDAAETSIVITNQSGEAPNAARLVRQRLQAASTDGAGAPITKQQDQFWENTIGGNVRYLKQGQDMKVFRSDRPSVATFEFWNYLTAKICAGVGISRLLVFPYSMQGTVTRADLDVSNAFFRARSAVLAAACREVYLYAMQYAVKYDRQLDGAPKDGSALNLTIQPPRAVNVDVGRNSAALIAELDAGIRTFQAEYGEQGKNWMRELEQHAKERAFIHALGVKYKIDPQEIAATVAPPPENEPTERNTASEPEMATGK